MRTPFKLRSGNASAFKNLGSSPVKQDVKQKITKGVSKNINTPGWKTTTVSTAGPKVSGGYPGTSTITTLDKTGQVVAEGGSGQNYKGSTKSAPKNFNTTGSKASTTPKWDPTKRQDVTKYVKGTKAYKAANPAQGSLKQGVKAFKNANTTYMKKEIGKKIVSNLGKKAVNVAKNVAGKASKFLGGKALGVAGMMMATSSKADQPKFKKSEGEQIKDLLTKHKLKGGRK